MWRIMLEDLKPPKGTFLGLLIIGAVLGLGMFTLMSVGVILSILTGVAPDVFILGICLLFLLWCWIDSARARARERSDQ